MKNNIFLLGGFVLGLFLFTFVNSTFAGVIEQDWPDAIICSFEAVSGSTGFVDYALNYYQMHDVDGAWFGHGAGSRLYAGSYITGSNGAYLAYAPNGDFVWSGNYFDGGDCTNKSISDLVADNQVFNFGGSGTTTIGGTTTQEFNIIVSASTTVFDQVKYYSDFLFYGVVVFSIWFFGMVYYFKRRTQI